MSIRILFLAHGNTLYGANRSLLNLIDGLRAYPEVKPVVLLQGSGALQQALSERGVGCYTLPFDSEVYTRKGFSRVKGAMRHVKNRSLQPQINRLVGRLSPDLIHTNTRIIYAGAIAAQKHQIPHVMHIREFGKQDYNFAYNLGERHHERVLEQSAWIIAISKAIASTLPDRLAGKVHLLYNGIIAERNIWSDTDRHFPAHYTADRPFTLCIVGFLMPTKGQDQAIEAFGKLGQQTNVPMRLLIVGDTPEQRFEQYLRGLVAKYGIEQKVRFMGYLDDTAPIYAESDVCLMCSRSEGMGRVTVEAMATGLPVIGYRGGATPELIDHEHNGLLYQSSDELQAAILRLIEDRTLLRTLSGASLAKARHFTQEQYADGYRAMLRQYLGK